MAKSIERLSWACFFPCGLIQPKCLLSLQVESFVEEEGDKLKQIAEEVRLDLRIHLAPLL